MLYREKRRRLSSIKIGDTSLRDSDEPQGEFLYKGGRNIAKAVRE